MADQVRINGAMHSWSSVVLKIGGVRYTGVDSIGYGDKIERVYGYGMGRSHAPRGRSTGKYTPEPVKIRGAKSTIEAIRQQFALLSPDQKSYGIPEVDISLQFVEPTDSIMSVRIARCKIAAETTSHEENPDPLKDEIELSCMYVVRNGKTLFDSTQGLP